MSFENLFTVNGVVVNENLRGQPLDLFIEDAIEGTTTVTSGVSAELGRFTGGVVNAITKSGGNRFSGSLRGCRRAFSSRPSTRIGTSSSPRAELTTESFFVNDRWRLNDRWSFNVGLRYDENDGQDSVGTTVASDSKLSPRFGASWDVRGTGDLVLNASYGTYVAAIANSVADSTSSGGAVGDFRWDYDGPGINLDPNCVATGTCLTSSQALQIIFDWYTGLGGALELANLDPNAPINELLNRQSVPGATAAVDGTLQSPSVDELSLGVTKQLGAKGLVRADLVYRDWTDFYAQRTDLGTGQVDTPNGPADFTLAGNFANPFLSREYTGLHTQFRYRFNDRLTVAGNYTLSKTEGNFDGETAGSGPVTSGFLNYPQYREARWNIPDGGRELEIFVQPEVTNLFDEDAVIDPFGRDDDEGINVLQAFDPFTEVPIEGVHRERSGNFGCLKRRPRLRLCAMRCIRYHDCRDFWNPFAFRSPTSERSMVSTGRALLAALLTLSFSAFLAPTEARGANDPECEELEARWTQLSESPLEACDEDPECKARRLRGLKGLRDTLAEHPPECQATTLPKVWALEFQLTSPTKHDGVRARVREDLERLRGLGLEHLDTWWRALQEGYESVGDAEAVTRLEEEAWEVAPCLSWTVRQQSSRWRETLFTSKEEETAILDLWEASHRWLERCPDEPRYTFLRAMAATKHPGLDDEELLVELDRHRRVWEASQDEPGAPSAPWGFLARTLLERNLELERAREFAEKAVAAARSAETSDSLEQVPAQVAERLRLRRRQQHFLHEIQGLSLLARAQFALGREDALQATFEEARATGARLEKLETEHADSLSMTFSSVLAPQAAIMTGQQAERMGHTADAFAFFRRALELRPGNPNLTEKVEELWQELGGSSMGWQALAASRTQQPAGTEGSKSTEGKADPAVSWDWEARNEPLPSLRLSDLQGRIWNKEDLAGQAVLINAWATWCGPCRVELPYVQELHERLANDETKTVVTLNSDQNVGLIQPFLEENGFDFPVLLALPFLQNELGGPPLPQSWIVDPSGTVRYQQAGFDSSRADTWIEDMLARLEEVSSLRQAE